ncbi:MAG TPA: HAD family phosphatase [Bacteroidales bacterium]|nr:HAD family phosphatase [Bacteroidales bacterium]
MKKIHNIKNIIFDLGAVVLDIDFEKTINAFKKLGIKDFENIFTKAKQDKIFDEFERGELSDSQFREALRTLVGANLSEQQIDDAWNAIIIDFREEYIDLLRKVKNNYYTFLLSNTNSIHFKVYNNLLKKYGILDISELFHKVYLSYKIGMRKPERRIFQYLIEDSNLNPSETLYIDDTYSYLCEAKSLGINTVHFLPNMKLTDLFTDKGFLF